MARLEHLQNPLVKTCHELVTVAGVGFWLAEFRGNPMVFHGYCPSIDGALSPMTMLLGDAAAFNAPGWPSVVPWLPVCGTTVEPRPAIDCWLIRFCRAAITAGSTMVGGGGGAVAAAGAAGILGPPICQARSIAAMAGKARQAFRTLSRTLSWA